MPVDSSSPAARGWAPGTSFSLSNTPESIRFSQTTLLLLVVTMALLQQASANASNATPHDRARNDADETDAFAAKEIEKPIPADFKHGYVSDRAPLLTRSFDSYYGSTGDRPGLDQHAKAPQIQLGDLASADVDVKQDLLKVAQDMKDGLAHLNEVLASAQAAPGAIEEEGPKTEQAQHVPIEDHTPPAFKKYAAAHKVFGDVL